MRPRIRRSLILIFLSFLVITAGCITKQAPDYIAPWQDSNSVTKYMEAYGRDYLVQQTIENGTAYETFTWPVQGLRVKAVMESGVIVREEKFDPAEISHYY